MTRLALIALFLASQGALADPAAVQGAVVIRSGGVWTLTATLRHQDQGPEDYMDAWRIETPDGTILATQTLSRPRIGTDQVTRSLTIDAVPPKTDRLIFRASTTQEGWSDLIFALPAP